MKVKKDAALKFEREKQQLSVKAQSPIGDLAD
jgi:hypothetical protein